MSILEAMSSTAPNPYVARANYGDLFERLLDPMFLVDEKETLILAANPAAERDLGSPEASLVGMKLKDLIFEKDAPTFEKYLRMAKRHPMRFEVRFKSAAGSTPVIEIQAGTTPLAGGEVVIEILCRDITYQKEIEQKLLESSSTDELTQLSNRRHFKTLATREHDRATRYRDQYAIILMDIDHFKNYNDRNGHPAGDALLREFSALLKKACRLADLPARYGGEEFIILCPSTAPKASMVLAERLLEAIRSHPFTYGNTQPLGRVTASIGVAGFPEGGSTIDDVIRKADEALYRSKNEGRNRASLAT
jgi:diguanylate cyclase (GGDEF)-like protein/PAS domain S-box-containing protein